MKIKKSLASKMEEAQRLSVEHPGVTFYVMDKPRKRAVVSGSEWVYKERVMERWYCYCKFKNGRAM